GAGPDRTRIVSHLQAPAEAVLRVEGEPGKRIGMLAQPLAASATALRTSGGAGDLGRGALVWLKEPNDDAFLQRLGSQRWNREYPYLRQSLVQVAGSADGALQL